MMRGPDIGKQVFNSIQKSYLAIPLEEDDRILDSIVRLAQYPLQKHESMQDITQETARMVFRNFLFKEVCVGLKTPRDGLYRYNSVVGYTREAERNLKSYAYEHEYMFATEEYPGIRVSKYTEFAVAEDEPFVEGEEKSYNRPIMLSKKRGSLEEFHEGDYIDFYSFGQGDDLVAWIEVSSPKDAKMPKRSVIKWMELVASILSLAVEFQNTEDAYKARKFKRKGLRRKSNQAENVS